MDKMKLSLLVMSQEIYGLVSQACGVDRQRCAPDLPARGYGWPAAPVTSVVYLPVHPEVEKMEKTKLLMLGMGQLRSMGMYLKLKGLIGKDVCLINLTDMMDGLLHLLLPLST